MCSIVARRVITPSQFETISASHPLVHQVFVYAESSQPLSLAVVVPSGRNHKKET